jgi:hypothetical protein
MALIIYPDPLVDSLPQPIRHAYRSAERALFSAHDVHDLVDRGCAAQLPGATGRLKACLGEQEVAVRAVEAELAAARGFVPFVAMGQAFTTAHFAAVHYGWEVVGALDFAAHPKEFRIVNGWGAEAVVPWGELYRRQLLECRVITIEGDTVRPGPAWRAFRKTFLDRLPDAQTEDLQTQLRLEVAAWAKEQSPKHTGTSAAGGGEQGEEWLPVSKAIERAEQAGLPITPSSLSRVPRETGVKTRPRQLEGNHRREVEWNSLVGYLARKRAAKAAAGADDDEPSGSEREQIEEAKKKARDRKKRDLSTD